MAAIDYAGGYVGGFGAYTPKADDVTKLTKLAKEEYGIEPDAELFNRLLDVVYGESVYGESMIVETDLEIEE